MKKTIIALAAVAALAGCTTAEKAGVIGAGGGALVGAALGGTEGALIGAVAGGAGGYLLGRAADRPGYCEYRLRDGRRVIEPCY